MVILQIEHIQAVNEIRNILAVSGIDAICIGPYDLSGSLGKLGQFDDPEVASAIDVVVREVAQTQLFLGVSTGYDAQRFERWLDKGIQWINLNTDWSNLFIQSKTIADAARIAASERRRQRAL